VARLANISGKEASKAFQKAGWQTIGQVGSHLVMSKPGLRVNLSIPSTKSYRWALFVPSSAMRE
jgi:predicted RNA binding protein YcfA (HicA-like mRNA interferase family)